MLKVAVIILVIMLAFAGVYSIMSLVTPKILGESVFQSLTGDSLESIQDAGYLRAILSWERSVGLFALATVISGFFILFAGFRKAEKWAWWAFLVVGVMVWAWGLINALLIGDKVNSLMELIGLVLVLVGVFIPVKAFFSKKA